MGQDNIKLLPGAKRTLIPLSNYWIASVICLFFVLSAGCKKDLPPNPYDDLVHEDPEDSSEVNLDPYSFAGLHYYIFKPTCANSGCHDGTFEPDFRTIESAYNTLVYHPVVKNDTNGTYTYRVMPGNVSKSVIYNRLTVDIDGLSGIMPLAVDPGSDWPQKKGEYIGYIKRWIEKGALDIFGNAPTLPDNEPGMLGVVAYNTGSMTPLARTFGGKGAFIVNASTTSVDLWFALEDDFTATKDLTYNKIKFSLYLNDFSSSSEVNVQVVGSPIQQLGYYGGAVDFWHKVTFNPQDYGILGNTVVFRIYVQDSSNDITEIPEDESANYYKLYFAFDII